MRHYQPRSPVEHVPIMSRVTIRGERFVWLKFPEAQWLAECNAWDDIPLIHELAA